MLNKGDLIPRFKLLDQNGQEFDSQSLTGSKAVIFFYPKDDTPVCTVEACSFQSAFESFKGVNATVVGISADSPSSHQNFAKKHRLDYPLLSDTDLKVERKFGLKRSLFGLLAQRVTFVFDEEGKLLERIDSRLNGKKHVKDSLKVLLG